MEENIGIGYIGYWYIYLSIYLSIYPIPYIYYTPTKKKKEEILSDSILTDVIL